LLFNSFEFLIFYILVVAVFFTLPQKRRWILLLIASYWFYMSWKVEYVLLIFAATLINYAVALGIERSGDPTVRKSLLALGVGSSLGILFTYKYADFVSHSVEQSLAAFGLMRDMPYLDLLLPLGISFYTFQAVGYAIDVYRGDTPAEHHFGIFALYVSFFPQLVAGPIERSFHLLPQFRQEHRLSAERVTSGLRIILWGLFKKVVVADSVSVVVETVYANPTGFSGPFLILATLLFAIQIYCDFSGYSDMAIGTARILGYDLMVNFRRPYFARSVSEFWRRWHISLSTWFRDYVYKPLGGNRVSRAIWIRNIMVVFVLSGIWHGANWTFLAWGFVHGAALVAGALTSGLRGRIVSLVGLTRVPRLHALFQTLIVVAIAVVAWVFFRAQSIDEAVEIISRFPSFGDARLSTLWALGLARFQVATTALAIAVLFLVEATQEFEPYVVRRAWSSRSVRWATYTIAVYAIVSFGVFGQMEFIYFQF
jgi:alginate O-acetyltransferase complex protein AlgI